MKLFKTASSDIVQEWHTMFGVEPVTDQVLDRERKFLTKFVAVSGFARAELDSMS